MSNAIIPLDKITPDPNNPRKHFDDITTLANNMKVEGLIHPIEIDKSYMLIVGERRFRAAKSLGWKEIKVTIHDEDLTPYERLRRQMSENIHQSAARNGESMNPWDTAKGWAKLYELKTGNKYNPGEYLMGKGLGGMGRGLKGPFLEIAEEIGANKETVWQLLQLLNEPEMIQEAIKKGLPRTYVREANTAPEAIRDQIKEKIVAGDYGSRDEIKQDIQIAKRIPDLASLEIERRKSKESSSTNRILNGISKLALALEDQPLGKINEAERKIVIAQLEWLQIEVAGYLMDK